MTRPSEEIEREVEATRNDLDRTVEALKDKMTPGQLFDELARSFQGTGASSMASDMASNLGSQVRENPLPLALIGAGIAWLMMGQGGGRGHASSAYPTTYSPQTRFADDGLGAETSNAGLADKASGIAQSVKSGLGHVAGSVSHAREGVASAAAHARDSGRSMGSGIADTALHARERAAQMGDRAQRTFMETLDHEPLIIGALGLAVGAAIGAALPPTRAEDKAMGAMRDRVLQKGKESAKQGIAEAKHVASTAVETVRQEAGAPGEGSLVEQAERVVRAGVDAAKSEFEQRQH